MPQMWERARGAPRATTTQSAQRRTAGGDRESAPGAKENARGRVSRHLRATTVVRKSFGIVALFVKST